MLKWLFLALTQLLCVSHLCNPKNWKSLNAQRGILQLIAIASLTIDDKTPLREKKTDKQSDGLPVAASLLQVK